MLNDWLCNGRDVIVEEEVIRACSLSEWIYRRVVVGGVVGRGDGLEACQECSSVPKEAEKENTGVLRGRVYLLVHMQLVWALAVELH